VALCCDVYAKKAVLLFSLFNLRYAPHVVYLRYALFVSCGVVQISDINIVIQEAQPISLQNSCFGSVIL
jgi:hypothetical protein